MSNCVAAESKAFVLGLKQEVAQADVSAPVNMSLFGSAATCLPRG